MAGEMGKTSHLMTQWRFYLALEELRKIVTSQGWEEEKS
ncbi:hypothetical protein CCP4SC76_6050003 [Gammaproteobacteria bacterium]